MNKVYRIIWSDVRHAYTVVSEIAKAQGKKSSESLGKPVRALLAAAVLACGFFAAAPAVQADAPTTDGTKMHQYVVLGGDRLNGREPGYNYVLIDDNDNIIYHTSNATDPADSTITADNGRRYTVTHSDGVYTLTPVNGGTAIKTYRYGTVNLGGTNYRVRTDYNVTRVDGEKKYSGQDREGRATPYHNAEFITSYKGTGEHPSDVLFKVDHLIQDANFSTNLGEQLQTVTPSGYVPAATGGTEVTSAYNIFIDAGGGNYKEVGLRNTSRGPDQFVAVSTGTNAPLQWNETYNSYVYTNNGKLTIVPMDNMYVIDGKAGIFTNTDGSLYTGTVYGANNDYLLTTKGDDGNLYSFWGAENRDPTMTMEKYPVEKYKSDIETLVDNDKTLGHNDIHHVSNTAGNNTATVSLWRNGVNMDGSEAEVDGKKVNEVAGLNLTATGGTAGIGETNDRKLTITNGTNGNTATFDLGSQVGKASDVDANGNLRSLTINGTTYGMQTKYQGNNVNGEDSTVTKNLGETLQIQGDNKNFTETDATKDFNILATGSNTDGNIKLSLNDDLKLHTVTLGTAKAGEDSTPGAVNIVSQNGTTETITAVDGETQRLQYAEGDKTHTLATLEDDGLTFSGDDTTNKVTKKLNEELTVKGGADGNNLSEGNIGVRSDGNNGFTVNLAKDINGVTSIGNTTTNAGTTTGSKIAFGADGTTTISGGNVSVSNNKITNVEAGEQDTDAVNVSQLNSVKETAEKGWEAQVGGTTLKDVTPDSRTLNFAAETNPHEDNLTITGSGDTITIANKKDVNFQTVSVGGTKGGDGTYSGGIYLGSTVRDTTKIQNSDPNASNPGGFITGLTNTNWENGHFVSGRAATEDQLNKVAGEIRGEVSATDIYLSSVEVAYDDKTGIGTATSKMSQDTATPTAITGLKNSYVNSVTVSTATEGTNAGKQVITITRNDDAIGIDGKHTAQWVIPVSDLTKGLATSDWRLVGAAQTSDSGTTYDGSYTVKDGEVTLNVQDRENPNQVQQVKLTGLNTVFAADNNASHGNADSTVSLGSTIGIKGRTLQGKETYSDTTAAPAVTDGTFSTQNVSTKLDAQGNIVINLADNPQVKSIVLQDGDTNNTTVIKRDGDNISYTTNEGDKIINKTIATTDSGLSFKGNSGDSVTKSLGDTTPLNIVGEGTADDKRYSGRNIKVIGSAENGGQLTIATNKDFVVNTLQAGSIDGKGGADRVAGIIRIIGNAKNDGLESIAVTAGYDGVDPADADIATHEPAAPYKADDKDGITRLKYQGSVGQTEGEKASVHYVATLEDGYKLAGDTGSGSAGLNKTLTISGGAKDNLAADNNIGVTASDAGWTLKLNKDITGLTTVTAGGAKLGTQAPQLTENAGFDASGSYLTGLTNKRWFASADGSKGGSVQNGDKISYVSGRAATEDQLNDLQQITNKRLNDVDTKAGQHTTVSVEGHTPAGTGDAYSGKNLLLNVRKGSNNQEVYDLKLADNLTFGEKGKDGKDGVDGTIGVNGKDGSAVVINGKDGSIGLNGKDGENGLTIKGGKGADGTTRIIYETKDGETTVKHEVATMDDGLNFKGDDGTVISKKLSQQLDIIGGADSKNLTEKNIGVNSTADGQLKVQLAKDLDLTPGGSVKMGDTTINNGGVTITNTDATKTVSLTNVGLNNGGNKITNVANGEADTDAVNMSQLKEVQKVAGQHTAVTVEGGTTAGTDTYSGKNLQLKVTKDENGKETYDLKLADELSFGQKGEDGKDGQIGVNGKDGSAVVINGKDGSIGLNGKDGANGLTIKGDKGADGTTRIVYETKDGETTVRHEVATMDDGLKFKGDDGNVISKKLSEQLDIVGGADSKNLSENNIGVNSTADGKLKVQLAKDVKGLNSVTTGDEKTGTTINKDGITINNGGDASKQISITNNNISMGGQVIHNVGDAVNDTDAVNYGQLKKVQETASAHSTVTVNGNAAGNLKKVESKNDAGGTNYDVSLSNQVTLGNKDDNGSLKVTDGTNTTSIDSTSITTGNIKIGKLDENASIVKQLKPVTDENGDPTGAYTADTNTTNVQNGVDYGGNMGLKLASGNIGETWNADNVDKWNKVEGNAWLEYNDSFNNAANIGDIYAIAKQVSNETREAPASSGKNIEVHETEHGPYQVDLKDNLYLGGKYDKGAEEGKQYQNPNIAIEGEGELGSGKISIAAPEYAKDTPAVLQRGAITLSQEKFTKNEDGSYTKSGGVSMGGNQVQDVGSGYGNVYEDKALNNAASIGDLETKGAQITNNITNNLGGQINKLSNRVNKVGAGAAAMANLHPLEFDPDSKWNIAAAVGNYRSATATAIGAFYRPNEDLQFNVSTSFGNGENMVGGGVSFRLGHGGNKARTKDVEALRAENDELRARLDDLTARMDALLSVVNPAMSKEFPDVPKNHWAYEAVSKLGGNGIVEGFEDGKFHGDETMTRYQMAEIIYNALAKGVKAEQKLVEEFKPELQAMAAQKSAPAQK